VKNYLRDLACFNHVESINEIASGLSQHCFTVHADDKLYFAKTLHSNVESKAALSTAKNGLSPAVFYHDQQWLITEFVNGDSLALSEIDKTDKINCAISLMVQCHQHSAELPELTPVAIIDDLIFSGNFSAQKKDEYLRLSKSIIPPLKSSVESVCCHGDLNFSNVLVDHKKNAWLVDYECACTAPAEYDLAMFIAVNNIAENNISEIIEQYERQSPATKINSQLLQSYLVFSYFINSLWYNNAYQSQNDITLLSLHQQQWQRFISLAVNI
jgi:thiamine kinase-like enzyme